MTIVEAVKRGLQKYFVFSGRASREEFWKFVLGLFLVSLVLSIVDSVIFGPVTETNFVVRTSSEGTSQSIQTKTQYGAGPISSLFNLAVLIPWLAAANRRLHDTGRAGWHLALVFGAAFALMVVSLFGFMSDVQVAPEMLAANPGMPETMRLPQPPALLIFLSVFGGFGAFILGIVWLARRGQPDGNRYGSNPLSGEVEHAGERTA